MRLLIIECGDSKLPAAITNVVGKLYPKPEMVSTMNLNLARLNFPEFKHMLYNLAPDTVIIIPPSIETDLAAWNFLLDEAARAIDVTSGRILFVSSVEVLGDAYQRTEDAVVMPCSDYGMWLHMSELRVENRTSRHYILRFPYTVENEMVLSWVADPIETLDSYKNQWFNLITLEDAAKVIVARIQTGLYGKYHATPNDRLALSDLVGTEVSQAKIPDRSLSSKYNWQVSPSKRVWETLQTRKGEV